MTYESVHRALREIIGPASGFACSSCGGPAQHWALQYAGGEHEHLVSEEGRAYSESLCDYAPMCRACHARLDWAEDERVALLRRAGCYRGGIAVADRWKRDLEFADAGRRRQSDIMKQRWQIDARFAEESRVRLARNSALGVGVRRCCNGCGKETRPGPLVLHQRASGHVGWTPA